MIKLGYFYLDGYNLMATVQIESEDVNYSITNGEEVPDCILDGLNSGDREAGVFNIESANRNATYVPDFNLQIKPV